MTMSPGNVISLERVELELDPDQPGIYSGMATVEEGALLRYTYDRWDVQSIDGWSTSRESVENVYEFVNRYVLVSDEVDLVDDAVSSRCASIVAWSSSSVSATGTEEVRASVIRYSPSCNGVFTIRRACGAPFHERRSLLRDRLDRRELD
ncbi:MAG: hypothetical protein QF422_03040 [Dehalococcoidia bacterium]|jgi:hypothetical protein|nr:hypothetical protein [Dehalococcoidia bacterium]